MTSDTKKNKAAKGLWTFSMPPVTDNFGAILLNLHHTQSKRGKDEYPFGISGFP
jgi:hypothetical protein